MPYIRMTVTISAAYHVTNTNATAEEVARHQEDEMRESLQSTPDGVADKLRRLIAFAKLPGGTITWVAKPEKEPPQVVVSPPPPPPTPQTYQEAAKPQFERHPKVQAEMGLIQRDTK